MPPVRVSVVIPAWNVQDWISETIASVAAQTYPKQQLEIVVVDDGSSDDTASSAHSALRHSGVRHLLLRHAASTGPSAARNRGWRAASGDWIQFLDADDLLEPEKIALQMSVADESGDDVAVLYSKWGRVAAGRKERLDDREVVEPVLESDTVASLLDARNFLQVGSQLNRRTWLEKVGGFDESLRLVEDVELALRVAMAGGVFRHVSSQSPVCWYRQRPGSASRRNDLEFVRACVRNSRIVEEHWRAEGRLTLKRVNVLVSNYASAARFLAEHHLGEFDVLLDHIHQLAPRFKPAGPPVLRYLSALLGYRRAEAIAKRYRRLKRAARRPATAFIP